MDKCKFFLDNINLFAWFIVKYFGAEKLNYCIELANKQNTNELMHECNDIWFNLPDNIFNIVNKPLGWMQFLTLLED